MADHEAGKDGAVTGEELNSRLAARTTRYRELVGELANIGVIASGSLALRSHRCGKANCACGKEPPRLHGPYWHLTTKVAGKTVNRRLSDQDAASYQEWIANDRRLRSIVDELRSVGQDVIELTLASNTKASRV
ncbi:MAG: DUF6788 family protein [bacterium]